MERERDSNNPMQIHAMALSEFETALSFDVDTPNASDEEPFLQLFSLVPNVTMSPPRQLVACHVREQSRVEAQTRRNLDRKESIYLHTVLYNDLIRLLDITKLQTVGLSLPAPKKG